MESSKPVSPKSIGRLFKTLKDNILCVILDACYGQLQAEGIAESIDCVVGMTRAIPDEWAIRVCGQHLPSHRLWTQYPDGL